MQSSHVKYHRVTLEMSEEEATWIHELLVDIPGLLRDCGMPMCPIDLAMHQKFLEATKPI